ncbi:MAG: hypothetical protein VB934_06125 [Polyangiaceae bacterium]
MSAAAQIVLVALAVGSTLCSCRSVLGLEDYEPAIDILCGCPDVPEFGSGDCRAELESRLSSATSATREAWLKNFVDRECSTSCSQAFACFQMSNTCTPVGVECSELAECCGSQLGDGDCAPTGRCPP